MNLTSDIRRDQIASQSTFSTCLDSFNAYSILNKHSNEMDSNSIDIDFPRLWRIRTESDSSMTEIILFCGVSND